MKRLLTPHTLADASQAVADASSPWNAELLAGGTDVVDRMRQGISVPDPLVRIARLLPRGVEETAAGLRIGAGTSLQELIDDARVRALPVLKESLEHTATPQIRAGATVGGALRQRVRCPYYRHPALQCLRKGGDSCLARSGENHAHAIFDNAQGCVAVHPSTLLAALLAVDALITVLDDGKTRAVAVAELVKVNVRDPVEDLALPPSAIITHVDIPASARSGRRQGYLRASPRELADWATVEVTAWLREESGIVNDARVVLGAVARAPRRSPGAEAALVGKRLSQATIADAAARAAAGATPLEHNHHKVKLVEGSVRALLERIGRQA